MPTQLEAASNSHLRRSKSSTSVQDRRKHPLIAGSIDPEQARSHALIAAHRAMNRSSGSKSDKKSQTHSIISSHVYSTASVSRDGHLAAVDLQRRRSLLPTRSAEGTSLRLPTSLTSTDAGDLPSYSEAGLLPEFGESYGAEPSSFRRLRKAKSMLEPAKKWRQAHSLSSRSPASACRTLRHTTSQSDFDRLALRVRLKRSISILKRRNLSSPPRSSIAESPKSTKMTRSSFLQARTLPQISKKASAFFHPKVRKIRNEFRMTLRSSEYVSPDLQPRPPPNALERARSMSGSLRNKFMRAFSKTGVVLPPQHLEASRAHFREIPSRSDVNEGFDSYDGTLFESGNPYASLPHDPSSSLTPEQQKHTIALVQTSQENLEDSSGSRVTSWTNSTNTGSLRETLSDRKRLSVIKEDGSPHRPSCSAGTHLGGVAIRTLPSQQGQALDSQRLYSALIRRINQDSDDNQRLQTIEDDEEGERGSQSGTPATIVRRSRSQDTLRSTGPASEYREFSIGNPWQECSTLSPEKVKENMSRRKEKLKLQEQQTTFFPHSTSDRPETESPFRLHLNARRAGHMSKSLEDLATEIDKPRSTQGRDGRVVENSKYLFSSESFYSQATNADVVSRHDMYMESEQQVSGCKDRDASEGRSRPEAPTREASSLNTCDDPGKVVRPTLMIEPLYRSAKGLHTREYAQVDTSSDDSSPTPDDDAATKAVIEREEFATNKNSSSIENIPTQLQVAKNRATLSGYRPMSQEQLIDQHDDHNLPHKRSGVLQQITNGTRSITRDDSKLLLSIRKASPMEFVRRLRSKASMPALLIHPDTKENRPDTAVTRNSDEPASTPGPYYLATRKQISPNHHNTKQRSPFDPRPAIDRRALKEESPTDRFKAGLSARLSKPFDMDTPNLNRPFDSMYLGKREAGFADSASGRLSTRRLTGGYGGLGHSPFETPGKVGEGTALPHFPTPDTDEKAKYSTKLGRSIGSKRIVSNFLRSRRRANRGTDDDSANGEQSRDATAPRWDSEEIEEAEHGRSPLFV